MIDKITKQKVLNKLRNMGFSIQKVKRNQFLINNNIGITLKYSKIYKKQNITWFGLKENISYEAKNYESYFILFIIEDSNTVLVTPFNKIRDILRSVRLTSKSTYRIHIWVESFISEEGKINLRSYLNKYKQLRY